MPTSKKSSKERATPLLQDNSLKTKEVILAAALKIFASNGYDGTSMKKITERAGVAAPLIHYYFKSKESLWQETIAYSLADLHRNALAIGDATRGLPPLNRLRAFIQMLTQYAAHWSDNFVMTIAEARSESDRFTWIQENYTNVIFQELLSILQDAKDQKLIHDVALDKTASLLIGGMLIYFTATPEICNNTNPKELDRISAEYTDWLFTVLLRGIGV